MVPVHDYTNIPHGIIRIIRTCVLHVSLQNSKDTTEQRVHRDAAGHQPFEQASSGGVYVGRTGSDPGNLAIFCFVPVPTPGPYECSEHQDKYIRITLAFKCVEYKAGTM